MAFPSFFHIFSCFFPRNRPLLAPIGVQGMVYNAVRAALVPYEAGLEVKPAIIKEEELELLVRHVKGCERASKAAV